MKYRVAKENPTNLPTGTELEYDPTIEGIEFRGMGNKWFIGRDAIEYCDWFEAVPKVEVGQYWEWNDSDCESCIFRIQAVHSETEAARIKYLNDVEKDWYWADITEDATPLSDDQVEQALTEEAKRRGFPVETWRDPLDEYKIYSNTGLDDRFRYESNDDCLTNHSGVVYKQGQWAEIIEGEWEVKEPGLDRYVGNGNTEIRKREKGAFKILTREQAEAIAKALNDL